MKNIPHAQVPSSILQNNYLWSKKHSNATIGDLLDLTKYWEMGIFLHILCLRGAGYK